MFQLIYLSNPATGLTRDGVRDIAVRSRRFNRERALTGVLVLSGETILQFLEGDEETVRALYKRILRDTRHVRCDMVMARHTRLRSFPGHPMGYCIADDGHACDLNRLLDGLKAYDIGAAEQMRLAG
ncbi:BLUF domain-containing protein [uncultured Algimonas sp.]|uniref:BLUF domain-containing protein n=1 Tax=uncultured Algimonas sp. TaxID=1547920 RepID=UPI00263653E7|nr:BLUF domain-containing protein [uncultured Algimonas sp.]